MQQLCICGYNGGTVPAVTRMSIIMLWGKVSSQEYFCAVGRVLYMQSCQTWESSTLEDPFTFHVCVAFTFTMTDSQTPI